MSAPVVVGIDGSESASRAVRWAAEHALRRGTALRIVHACTIPVGYPPGFVDPTVLLDAIEKEGAAALVAARDLAEELAAGLRVETAQVRGDAVAVLAQESATAATLVLGTRGLGGVSGLVLGSVAVGLVAQARCPVVVVRADERGADTPAGPVVVGVDGTPTGESAIAFAFAEASAAGAELVAVHAWTDLLVETAFAGGAAALDFAPLAQEAAATLGERLAGWQEKYPDVRVTRDVVRDRPSQALLRHAADARLVVVGSRGRGGFRGLLLGSTSQHLLHHAPCPVAVIRTTPEGGRH